MVGEHTSKLSVGFGNHSIAYVFKKKSLESYYINSIIFGDILYCNYDCDLHQTESHFNKSHRGNKII